MQDSIQNELFAESEAVFSDIFHSISEGIVYANAKGKILAINRAMETITLLSHDQLIGKNVLFLAKKILSAKNASIALPFLANILLNRDFQPIEIEYAGKVLEITAKRNKANSRIIGILRDITKRKKAEEALRKSENRFKKVFDMLPIGLWIADEKGKLVQGNPAGVKIWGMEPKVGQNDYGVFQARRLPSQQEIAPGDWALAHTINEGQTIIDELLEIDAFDGKKKIILNYTAPLLDSTGKVEGAIVVNQDITERKQAEETLRKSEEMMRSIYRVAPTGIGVVLERHLIEVNPGICEMTGYTREELLEKNARVLYASQEEYEFVGNENYDQIRKYGSGKVETHWQKKDGSIINVLLASTPIDLKDHSKGITFTALDITDRLKTQEDLKRIEWMLSKSVESIKRDQNPFYGDLSKLNTNRLILDSVGKNVLEDIAEDFLRLLETSSAVYEKNGDYALGIFASNWCRYMDQASRALCGTDDNKEALNSGEWLCHDCCWKEASQQAIQSGQAVDIECTGGIHLYALPIFAGKEIIGAINFGYGDPPRDEAKIFELAEKYKVPSAELMNIARQYESRPPYIIDMAKKRLQTSANLIGEIVSRKNAQKELLKLNEDLEQRVQDRTAQLETSIKELEAFSYSISHDLRAPLRHICGFIELLNQDFHKDLPEEAQHYLDVVSRAAKKMSTLIDELLKFSRTGRQELQHSQISMTKIVNEILEEVKLNTQERDISWKIQELPQVLGDYSLLKQVWINLIDNAVKYTSKTKQAEISIGFEEEESRNVFFIKDNGVGFDMKYVDKIFGVFHRLHTDKEFEGIGIGLSNVQRIIHKHLGEVWAESSPNHGATLYFSLPK